MSSLDKARQIQRALNQTEQTIRPVSTRVADLLVSVVGDVNELVVMMEAEQLERDHWVWQ